MPKGMKGFQPGREKTGGRPTKTVEIEKKKAQISRKPSRFVDQLSLAGFDYVKELASALKEIRDLRRSVSDPVKAIELKTFYSELKSLLPFMAPKLREKDVDTSEPAEAMPTEAAISTEDLLKAFSNDGKETSNNKRPSNSDSVGTGDIVVPPAPGPEVNLQNLVNEQEEDQ